MSKIKDKDMEKVSIRGIIVLILAVIATLVVGTFAWLTYRSNDTALVLTIGDLERMSVTLKPYQITASLTPTNNYTTQKYVDVSANNKKTTAEKFRLYYQVDSIDSALIDDGFKYTIVKSTNNWSSQTVVKEGNFSTASSGNELEIYDESIPGNNTTYQYKVYLWIDSTDGNQGSMQGKVFKGELRAEVGNASVPNQPILDTGMIPVTISNNGTVTSVSENDPSWYNYDEKIWANAVLVKESGVKTRAANKVAGTIIDPDDILAYYVWIPRYKYAIPGIKCKDITNVNKTDYPGCYGYDTITKPVVDYVTSQMENSEDNAINCLKNEGSFSGCGTYYINQYNSNNGTSLTLEDLTLEKILLNDKEISSIEPASINIVFESADTPKSTGTAVGTSYYTHPAFTFGTKELDGIWVGKFETSHNTLQSTLESNSLRCNDTACTNASGLRILPNAYILGFNDTRNEFYAARSMEQTNNPFGILSSDSHMMKNSEWGAVAYLSHSNYGINTEIRINNDYYYITGCGADSANKGSSPTCEIPYGEASNYPQSTTGNISGIFDMSGGKDEDVMGFFDDNSGILDGNVDAKYYDSYPATIFTGSDNTNFTLCTIETCGGHALNETKGWYDDLAYFVYSRNQNFIRGGYAGATTAAGAFYVYPSGSAAAGNTSFRVVLVASGT